MINEYDVAVIGAGHAGCEAAYASARMGVRTVLITIVADNIAQLACSPSFGGPGRGQLIREIDALGGLTGRQIERNLLFKKTTNTSKGTAVQAPWGIVDRRAYAVSTKLMLEKTKDLYIFQSEVTKINKNGNIFSIETLFGLNITARSVVIAAGTFLEGKVFLGKSSYPGGRQGELPSIKLVGDLKKHGFELGRSKTGSPPIVSWDVKTYEKRIGKSYMSKEPSLSALVGHGYEKADDLASFSSFTSHKSKLGKLNKLKISNETVSLMRESRLSGYAGRKNKVLGTRYCPSFEDKISNYDDVPAFSVIPFPLDPLGQEVYLHGLSMSIEPDMQQRVVSSVAGLETAKIIRPGYAVEYDFILPGQLKHSLESRDISGLFFGGQVNGTTGYEEAAAQGLIAGINAALAAKEQPPLILNREDAFIGVMIDDIVSKGVDEPYRMHSSRSELRLALRCENADLRLSQIGFELGLLAESEIELINWKRSEIFEGAGSNAEIEHVTSGKFKRNTKQKADKAAGGTHILIAEDQKPQTTKILYRAGKLSYIGKVLRKEIDNEKGANQLYSEMIRIEAQKLKRIKQQDLAGRSFTALNLREISGLSNEGMAMLDKYKPTTVNELKLIPGLTPEDLSLIVSDLSKKKVK